MKQNKMKQILLVIFKICLGLFLVVTLNLVFMPKYISENRDGSVTREFYREKLDTDVLFVGPSTVYSAVVPPVLWEEYGIISYDRANSSQTIWMSYYLIKDAIECHKPKMVVLDVGFTKFKDDYAEEPCTRKTLDSMRISKTKFDCIRESMAPDEKMLDYMIPLFRFHTRWKELTAEDFKYAFYKPSITNNGYQIDYRTSKEIENGVYIEKPDTEFGPKTAGYLRKCIELCQENDVQIMLVKMPSCSTNWTHDFDRQITEIANDCGVVYRNFDFETEEIGLDFYQHSPDEGSHLNTPGAEIFTSYLGKILREDYDIPNHGDDPQYQKVWSEKVRIYEERKVNEKNNPENSSLLK